MFLECKEVVDFRGIFSNCRQGVTNSERLLSITQYSAWARNSCLVSVSDL